MRPRLDRRPLLPNNNLNFKAHCENLAAAGGRALGKIISKFKLFKNIGYKTFTKLFESGVEPVISYGAEIWGSFDSCVIERVQYKACRYFLGVHPLCPLPALIGDMGWLPCKYKRIKQLCNYWNRMMRMGNDRLTKKVFLYDLEACNNNWCHDFYIICEKLDIVNRFDNRDLIRFDDIKDKITFIANDQWSKNVNSKPKLRTYKTFKYAIGPEPYVSGYLSRFKRSLLAQLRSGILPLNIEVGRFRNIKLEDRICSLCPLNVVESEQHFILECPVYTDFRIILIHSITNLVHNFSEANPIEVQFTTIMQQGQKELANFIFSAWNRRQRLMTTTV